MSRFQLTPVPEVRAWGVDQVLTTGRRVRLKKFEEAGKQFDKIAEIAHEGGAALVVYQLENGSSGSALAIVTKKNIQARLATAESAGAVLVLPPGSEIKILSTRGDWSYAALPNDLRGWIPSNGAERVRL